MRPAIAKGCTPLPLIDLLIFLYLYNCITQWFSTFFEPGPTLIFKKMSGLTRTTIRGKVFVFTPSLHCLLRDINYKCTHSKVYSNSLRYSITLFNGSSALAGYIGGVAKGGWGWRSAPGGTFMGAALWGLL